MPPNSVETRGQNFVKWIEELKQRPAPVGLFESVNSAKNEVLETEKTDAIDIGDNITLVSEDKLNMSSATDLKLEIQPVIAGQEAN